MTFFHHIWRRRPLLRTRKSCAPTPKRSVLSTSESMRSPRCSTRSMFSVMIPRTSSISCLARPNASSPPSAAAPYRAISSRSRPLNAAQPYAGSSLKSVSFGGYCARKASLAAVR